MVVDRGLEGEGAWNVVGVVVVVKSSASEVEVVLEDEIVDVRSFDVLEVKSVVIVLDNEEDFSKAVVLNAVEVLAPSIVEVLDVVLLDSDELVVDDSVKVATAKAIGHSILSKATEYKSKARFLEDTSVQSKANCKVPLALDVTKSAVRTVQELKASTWLRGNLSISSSSKVTRMTHGDSRVSFVNTLWAYENEAW